MLPLRTRAALAAAGRRAAAAGRARGPLPAAAAGGRERDAGGTWASAGLATAALAALAAAQAQAPTQMLADEAAGDRGAAQEDLKKRLLARLAPVRERRRSSPSVQIGLDRDGVWRLAFTVASPADLGPTINALARTLQTTAAADAAGTQRLVVAPAQTSDAEDDRELSLVLDGGKASVSASVLDNGACRLTFYKDDHVSDAELDAFVAAYAAGAFTSDRAASLTPRPRRAWGGFMGGPNWRLDGGGDDDDEDPFARAFASASPGSSYSSASPSSSRGSPLERLEALGAVVYREEAGDEEAGSGALDWSCLAGYDDVRRDVEDSVLLGLKHPEEYDTVTRKTRARFESNRPRAILFEGPPGTGKTTTARIVASQAKVPMVYIPIESVMSKFYGESESRLSEMLKLCDELGNAIVFLDEIDSLATSRDGGSAGGMHEATRRLLSVLLRTLEGFQERTSSILIAATNRKQDLDAALVSRFDMSIAFPLPSEGARRAIFARYARQLTAADLDKLASEARGFSGRDIKDMCKHAERRWVSQCLRQRKGSAAHAESGAELEIAAPPMQVYVDALRVRAQQIQRNEFDFTGPLRRPGFPPSR